jgi:hypothetical protein
MHSYNCGYESGRVPRSSFLALEPAGLSTVAYRSLLKSMIELCSGQYITVDVNTSNDQHLSIVQ